MFFVYFYRYGYSKHKLFRYGYNVTIQQLDYFVLVDWLHLCIFLSTTSIQEWKSEDSFTPSWILKIQYIYKSQSFFHWVTFTIVLDGTGILIAIHFSKNIYQSYDLYHTFGGATSMSANNDLCLLAFA